MKIIIMGDTHIPKRAKTLPSKLVQDLKDADLIIHTGDWQSIEVYKELSTYAKVEGVYGNVDESDIKEIFGGKICLDLNGYKIGVVHGHGEKSTTERRALAAFKGEAVDCILFGHSHIPVKNVVNNVLLFNPGSATDKRRQASFSYGVMRIEGEISVEHVFYEDKN